MLKDLEKSGEIRFKDDPFRYPDWKKEEPKSSHPLYSMYDRYMSLQREKPNAVIVFRLGDFYEIFGEKAVTIGEELDLIVTSRDFGLEQRVPMIGFPYHVADSYLEKITEKRGVVVVEPNAEPFYLMSEEEVKGAQPIPLDNLIPVEDEDLPFDTDDEEEEFGEEDKIDDVEETEEETAQVETEIEPRKKEKSIRERKRKPAPQLSFFEKIHGRYVIAEDLY